MAINYTDTFLTFALCRWYVTLVAVFGSHALGLYNLARITDIVGSLMTTAVLFGLFVTIVQYVISTSCGTAHRMSGNLMYDIFMGAPLNPRIGPLDLKMFAEIRVPWTILFFMSSSAAVRQYQTYGSVSGPMVSDNDTLLHIYIYIYIYIHILNLSFMYYALVVLQAFMVLAHLLYVNACMKGEECIPTTWDIFYEKLGFMLIYWNFAGVPFVYCYSTLYILYSPRSTLEHPLSYNIFCYVLLMSAYYVWDTSLSQKNRFRMQQQGTVVRVFITTYYLKL